MLVLSLILIGTLLQVDYRANCHAVGIAFLISYRGYERKSFSLEGALSAFTVGSITMAHSLIAGCLLMIFYFGGTMATRYCAEEKKAMDGEASVKAARGVMQVACTAGVGVVLLTLHKPFWQAGVWGGGCFPTNKLLRSFVGSICCALGDTLASELGILSIQEPRLITNPFRKVPRGTNGGVTLDGFFLSAGGGLVIGASTLALVIYTADCSSDGMLLLPEDLASPSSVRFLILSGLAGLVGSVVDSLLGATLQASYLYKGKVISAPLPKGVSCEKAILLRVGEKWVPQGRDSDNTQGKHVEGVAYHISGVNVLSNEIVNLISAMAAAAFLYAI